MYCEYNVSWTMNHDQSHHPGTWMQVKTVKPIRHFPFDLNLTYMIPNYRAMIT